MLHKLFACIDPFTSIAQRWDFSFFGPVDFYRALFNPPDRKLVKFTYNTTIAVVRQVRKVRRWQRPQCSLRTINTLLVFQAEICYIAGWNVWGDWVLAVYHHNHKNWVPTIQTHNLWLIFMWMKQKKLKKNLKKNSKWPTQKNWVFQHRQKLSNFRQNFTDRSLG